MLELLRELAKLRPVLIVLHTCGRINVTPTVLDVFSFSQRNVKLAREKRDSKDGAYIVVGFA